jgi:uncharacterized phage protein (TIGR02216 family)
MRRKLPWQALMAAAFGHLRLSPESFWSMSPRELSAALGQSPGSTPLVRERLEALMAQYPDERSGDDDRG